jgi:hypothetical protein
MNRIENHLKKYALRLRVARGLRGSAFGALVGAAIASILALLDRTGTFYTTWEVLGICFAASAVLGTLAGFVVPVDKLVLADSVDRRLGLRNRLRTALECDRGSDFDRAVVTDAEAALEKERKNAFPLRLSRLHASAVIVMLLASGIFLLGNSPIFLSDAEKNEREELKAAAAQVRRVAKPLLERPQQELSTEERDLAERLQELAKDLEKGRVPKKDALADANELAEEAERLAKVRAEEAKRTLSAADALRKDSEKRRLEEAGFRDVDMDRVEQSDEQLENDAQDLSKAIREMEDKLSKEGLSEAERQQLEQQLAEAKKDLKQIELSKKAKDFLKRLQSHPAYKELLEMAKKLQSSGSGEAKALTEEQIKEMIKRLEELADQLKTDEDLRKFIEELMKALKECDSAGLCSGAALGLLGMLPGKGVSQDNFFANTGAVNKNESEQDIEAKSREHAVSGARDEKRGKETHIEIMGPTKAGDRTRTPYTALLPKYKKSAESAINRQQIPKSEQKRVREYFESLAGGK